MKAIKQDFKLQIHPAVYVHCEEATVCNDLLLVHRKADYAPVTLPYVVPSLDAPLIHKESKHGLFVVSLIASGLCVAKHPHLPAFRMYDRALQYAEALLTAPEWRVLPFAEADKWAVQAKARAHQPALIQLIEAFV